MKSIFKLFFVLLLLAFPCISFGQNNQIDWWADRVSAHGLSQLSTTAGSQARQAANDLATRNGVLQLRKLLYQLPVTNNSTLGMALVRFPTLQPLIDRELASKSSSGRVIAPDLLEVEVKASLPRLRRLLGPILLGKDPTEVKELEEPKPTDSIIITPPAGVSFTPGLLPLLRCREKSRDVMLKRLVAAHLIAGGNVAYIVPSVAAARAKRDAVSITADAVGGLGKASLFLKDTDADKVIESFKSATKEQRPELAIVLSKKRVN